MIITYKSKIGLVPELRLGHTLLTNIHNLPIDGIFRDPFLPIRVRVRVKIRIIPLF